MSCEYTTAVTLYLSHDNAVTVAPYSDFSERINYDMTAVTDVRAYADPVGSTTVGDGFSATKLLDPNKVNFDQSNPDNEWRIYAKVGLFTNIVAGTYTLRITIIDPDHPNGLVLPDTDEDLVVIIEDLP